MKRPYIQKYYFLRRRFWSHPHTVWVPGKGWMQSIDMDRTDWMWRWTP